MVAAAILQDIELMPGIHAVVLEADDGETYQSPIPVVGLLFFPARDNQASDSWGATYTRGQTLVTLRLTGTTTDVTCTLLVIGQ